LEIGGFDQDTPGVTNAAADAHGVFDLQGYLGLAGQVDPEGGEEVQQG
jgi:hypothetical protein